MIETFIAKYTDRAGNEQTMVVPVKQRFVYMGYAWVLHRTVLSDGTTSKTHWGVSDPHSGLKTAPYCPTVQSAKKAHIVMIENVKQDRLDQTMARHNTPKATV